MGLLSMLLGGNKKVEAVKEALQEGAIIVDVRSHGEFAGGHAKGSLNIPAQQIRKDVKSLAKKNKTVVLCCRSGARASQAQQVLEASGIKAINAGPWQTVKKAQNELLN